MLSSLLPEILSLLDNSLTRTLEKGLSKELIEIRRNSRGNEITKIVM